MRTFFRHLRASWLFLRFHPYIDLADAEPFWTDEDAAAYSLFMASPAGRKLRVKCGNLMTQSAVLATQNPDNARYRCGWASGISATFSWLDSHLFSPTAADAVIEGSDHGASDPFEQFAP